MWGFCYTRTRLDGTTYKSCPGYKTKSVNKEIKIPNKNMDKIINILKKAGYRKPKLVASKMMRYGRGMEDYSKIDGKLKKGR